MAKCSNPVCEFFEKEALFKEVKFLQIVTDVLRPGEFAPIAVAAKYFCMCGWIFTPIHPDTNKPGTVSPEEDLESGKTGRIGT
jgi:hypothetical protein